MGLGAVGARGFGVDGLGYRGCRGCTRVFWGAIGLVWAAVGLVRWVWGAMGAGGVRGGALHTGGYGRVLGLPGTPQDARPPTPAGTVP